ncbi:hypothetical protein ACHMW6_26865 [Pseudoduganella sp. UC29_106]|uniref:hypothetical protein n=1 Tax=Pseudoduganella sp. UC29_106 TaxID=3374553 RepID=UPI00375775EC
MSTVAIYSFQGRFSGQAEYEFNLPEPDAVHNCMLLLVQDAEGEAWDAAIAEAAHYGFADIQRLDFGIMNPAVLEEEAFQSYRVNYDEACALGSSLVYYPN